MQLRQYQHDTLCAVSRSYQSGIRRMITALATGCGKTVIFSNLYDHMNLGGQMIVLAHRDELIEQAWEKLKHWNPHLNVGVEAAGTYHSPMDDVIVASVATIGRAGSSRLASFSKQSVTAIVTDECHHSTSPSYRAIYDYFGLMDDQTDKLLLGVTATPMRGDGTPLAEVYQKIVYQYTLRQAIEDGWLSDLKAIRLLTTTSLDNVHVRAGDLAVNELSEAVNNADRNLQIVKAWKENAENRQTVAFTVDIAHAQGLAECFRRSGIPAEAIWGNDPDRARKLAAHKRREFAVLCNCAVLTEGYDDWRIGCVVMARPTKSPVLFTQCIGRGCRIPDGIGNLKEAMQRGPVDKSDCLIIDVCDNASKHSLISIGSIFGMGNKLDFKKKSVVWAKKKVEEFERDNPEVDFSDLQSLESVEAYVEQVDLWSMKLPKAVEDNSDFTWHIGEGGSYVLHLPTKETCSIRQNLLDRWEVEGTIAGVILKTESATIQEAFCAADDFIRTQTPTNCRLIAQQASWHDGAASPAQLGLLIKLRRGQPIPDTLTKGQASRAIDKLLRKKELARA